MCIRDRSLTALAAPADVTISNEHAKTGDTVTVTVSTTDRGLNADVQVSGLEITGVSGGMSTEENVNLIADLGGSQSVYTCVVTAEEGQDYSFTLTNVEVSVEGSGLQMCIRDRDKRAEIPAESRRQNRQG